jgi:hypothetical protein
MKDQIGKPSIAYWRDHSAGVAQTRDADPARQSPFDGSLHQFGREERERDRHIDLSNAAFFTRCNLLDTVVVPATSSASQRRPRAIDATSVARVSARIGRWSCGDAEADTIISRRRFIGVFFHGMRKTGRSWLMTWSGSLEVSAFSSTTN